MLAYDDLPCLIMIIRGDASYNAYQRSLARCISSLTSLEYAHLILVIVLLHI
jgi:hypothetical protein